MDLIILDKIVVDIDGSYTGYEDGQSFEVFPPNDEEEEEDDEKTLTDNGFVRCTAPGWCKIMNMREKDIPVIKLTEEDLVNAMVDFFGS